MPFPPPLPVRPAFGCLEVTKRRREIEAAAASAMKLSTPSGLHDQNWSGLAPGSDVTSANAARLVTLAAEEEEARGAHGSGPMRSDAEGATPPLPRLSIDLSGNKFRRCDELCESLTNWSSRLNKLHHRTQSEEMQGSSLPPTSGASARPELQLNLSGNPLKHESSAKLACALSGCIGLDVTKLDLSRTNALNESGPWRDFLLLNADHHRRLVGLEQQVRAQQQAARAQKELELKQQQLGTVNSGSASIIPDDLSSASSSKFGPQQLASVSHELQKCSRYEGVRILHFEDNHESYGTSQVFPLLRCLAGSPTLVSLSLSDCSLENEAMHALAEGLDGSGSFELSAGGSSSNFTLSSLKTLRLRNNRIGSDGLRILCVGIIRRHQAWFAKVDNTTAKKKAARVSTTSQRDLPPAPGMKRVTVEVPTSPSSPSFLQRDASVDEIVAIGKTMVYRTAIVAVSANKSSTGASSRRGGQPVDLFPIALEELDFSGNRIGHVPADSDHVKEGHLTPSTMVRSTASLGLGRGGGGNGSGDGSSTCGLSSRGFQEGDSASLGGLSGSSGKVIIMRGLPRIPECSSAIAPPDHLDPLPPPGAPLAYDPSGLLSLSVVCRLCQHSLRRLDVSGNHLGEAVHKSVVSGLGSGRVHRLGVGKDHGGVVEVCEAMRTCTKFLGSKLGAGMDSHHYDQRTVADKGILDYTHRQETNMAPEEPTEEPAAGNSKRQSGMSVSINLMEGNHFSEEALSGLHRASGLLVEGYVKKQGT